jgi:rubrerythrin
MAYNWKDQTMNLSLDSTIADEDQAIDGYKHLAGLFTPSNTGGATNLELVETLIDEHRKDEEKHAAGLRRIREIIS